jgi:protein TonB
MRCIHCGNGVQATDVSCRHCGARIVRPSTEESGTNRRSSAKAAAIYLLLLVAGAAVWFGGEDPAALWSRLVENVLPAAPSEPAATPTTAPPPLPPPPAPAPEAQVPVAPPVAAASPVSKPRAGPAQPPGATAAGDRRTPPGTKPDTPTARRAEPTLPAAPPEAASNSSQPVRVGGNIATPTKVRDVPPVYPPLAIQARVQGVVIIEATIGKDGAVDGARVLRSIPLLDPAALEAVRQWQFTPTLLNGVPVPVIMTVTVQFSLK